MRRLRNGLAVLVPPLDAAALVALRPDPRALLSHLDAPHRWVTQVGGDRAALELAGAAVWCVAAWLALCIATVLVAAAPGLAGRAGSQFAELVVPAALRRLLAGALGLGVALAPVTTAAIAAAPPAAAVIVANGPTTPAPTWPTNPPLAAPDWPTTSPTTQPRTSPTLLPTTAPTATTPTATTPTATTPTATTPTGQAPAAHVVRPGDSLWLIAATRLGARAGAPQIAAAWPQWYAANRTVIGPNPDLLVPGQVLHTPAAATSSEPS